MIEDITRLRDLVPRSYFDVKFRYGKTFVNYAKLWAICKIYDCNIRIYMNEKRKYYLSLTDGSDEYNIDEQDRIIDTLDELSKKVTST